MRGRIFGRRSRTGVAEDEEVELTSVAATDGVRRTHASGPALACG
jgi:hypothetical protein